MSQALPINPDSVAPIMQRSKGFGRLHVASIDQRTRISKLFQEGAAKIRVPRLPQSGLEAVLINTSGGLTGGDEVRWDFHAAPNCDLTLTTQACEKIYRSADGVATVDTKIEVGEGARVSWLPQETILFDRAGLRRNLHVELAPDAQFLAVEPVILGRAGMGEIVEQANLFDRWRIHRNGRLEHAEDLALSGGFETFHANAASLDGNGAFATLLYGGADVVAKAAAIKTLCNRPDVAFSQWEQKLVVRLACKNGQIMRKAMIPIIAALHNGAMPRIWNS